MTQAAPSGPTMTPCGDEPCPSLTESIWPVAGCEAPQLADRLRGIPDGAVGRRRDVMGMRTGRDVAFL